MTDLDHAVDAYLERLGDAPDGAGWDDVLARGRRRARRGRLTRLAAGGAAAAVAATAVALASGGGGPSLVEKAQAAEITGLPPAGSVSHVRDAYRDASGHVFIAYDSWLAADGSWCRAVLEEPVTDYTVCETAGGDRSLYLPARNEILRAPPVAPPAAGAAGCKDVPAGTAIRKTQSGWEIVYPDGRRVALPKARTARDAKLGVLAGSCDATSRDTVATTGDIVGDAHDLLATFALRIAREDGTRTLDGKTYPALATTNGDTVLVDPDTGGAVAWIPSPAAFGKPVVVLRTQETVPAGEAGAHLSLETLHPEATVRDVSAAELEQRLGAQYPNG